MAGPRLNKPFVGVSTLSPFHPPFPVENYRNCLWGRGRTRGDIFEREDRMESFGGVPKRNFRGKREKRKGGGRLIGRRGTPLYFHSNFCIFNFHGT